MSHLLKESSKLILVTGGAGFLGSHHCEKLMDTQPEITGPINLGNSNEFTILELAEKVITLTNSSSQIQYLPLPHDDPKQRQPDVFQANEKLNWESSIELGTGLSYTVPYFKEVINQM